VDHDNRGHLWLCRGRVLTSEIYRQSLLFPIPIAHGLGALAPPQFGRQVKNCRGLAAFLGLGKGAQGFGRQGGRGVRGAHASVLVLLSPVI